MNKASEGGTTLNWSSLILRNVKDFFKHLPFKNAVVVLVDNSILIMNLIYLYHKTWQFQ